MERETDLRKEESDDEFYMVETDNLSSSGSQAGDLPSQEASAATQVFPDGTLSGELPAADPQVEQEDDKCIEQQEQVEEPPMTQVKEEEEDEEEHQQQLDEDEGNSECPGTSEFLRAEQSETGDDHSSFYDNASVDWDSISNAVPTFVQEFLPSAEESKAIVDEISKLGRVLGQAFEKNFEKDFAAPPQQQQQPQGPRAPAPTESATPKPTVEQGEDWSGLTAGLMNALQHRHVVEALQYFLYQPIVADLVVGVCKEGLQRGKEGMTEQVLAHLSELLALLAQLIRAAPELLSLIPVTAGWMFNQWVADKMMSACSAASPPCPPRESVEVQQSEEEQRRTPEVVHRHVLCDGCNSEEKRDLARKNGHMVGNYIAGIRWKSAVVQDFDLCSTCEATGEFEEQYGPFLKITHPKKSPRELIVVLRDEPRSRRCGGGRGFQFMRRCQQQQQRSQVRPPAPQQPEEPKEQQQQEPAEEEQVSRQEENVAPATAAAPTVHCPNSHALEKFQAFGGYTCDVCEGHPQIGSTMFGCRRCNFDLCKDCCNDQLSSNNNNNNAVSTSTPPVNLVPPPVPPSVVPPSAPQRLYPRLPVESPRPRAKFVSDQTLPDGTVVEPNSLLRKIWRIENHGDSAWPQGVRLVNVGGDPMDGPSSGVAVPALQPGQRTDVELLVRAPGLPGRYVSYWRLMTAAPNPQRFGHRFWLDVSVANMANLPALVPQRPQPQQQETVQEQQPKWQEEVTKLVDMGFADIDRNIQLLEEEQGDLDKVIGRLC